ncbi:GNAT family N-acetyltransferase [Halostella litorea]|uniref:GNAT family N-acetyltransferase n=1 Tax=Halostella litorea TaxID=2528831 RepID=UPI001092327D|nr:GNAT family N-acetyltransferase [Halostella litorea]
MYVRDAKNREEVWLLDHLEAMGLDETAFRSRDYVIALDEGSGTKAGFGRIRIHKTEGDDVCELTSIGVLDGWRGQGVGAHVVERLVEHARDEGFSFVYALVDEPSYLAQFGFERIGEDELPNGLRDRLEKKREATAPDAVPMVLSVSEFVMPDRLRQRFKDAALDGSEEPEESPEDFGIDPESASYKYDTGG